MITVYPKRIDELSLDQLSPCHALSKLALETTRANMRILEEKRAAKLKARDRMSDESIIVDRTSNPTANPPVKRS